MPSDLIMFGYHLYLHPNFEGSYFKGHVKITIIAYNLSHDITLHASENLDISAADITVQTNTELEWYAVISVKPGTARKVFPCLDDSYNKTSFSISVARRKSSDLNIISSSAKVSTTENKDDPDYVWENFEELPQILPSSFGLVITDLQKQDSRTAPDFEDSEPGVINLYGQQNINALLNTVVQQLNFQQQYIGQSIRMTNINIIILPNFMSTRTAWGLILIPEMDAGNKLQVINELLNLWFDHLISPRPNVTSIRSVINSFFLHQQGVVPWEPSYFMYYSCATPELDKTHIPTTENMRKIEWLLRMLNYSLSEDTFSSGFKRFMLDRLYSIYSDEDLWYFLMKEGYLQEILDETFTIEELADIWLGTQRYPIVTVTRNYEDKKAIISQHTFIKQRPHTSSENETLWIIPIMYLSPSNLDTSKMRTSAWMNNEKEVNISGLPGSDDFIIVNPEEIGMFMVNYDPQNWNLLSDYLQSGTSPEIPALTRAKLLHDAWNIGYSGELDMTTALDLTLFLPHEKNSAVWSPFLNLVDHIHRLISGTSVEPKFVKYILKLLSTQSQDEDWVYSNLCAYGYEPYVAKGRESYNKWMNSNEKSLDYDVSVRDLCNALKWGSYEEYEFGLQQLQKYPDNNADLSEKRSFLLSALAACPLHAEKTNSLLKLVFQDEPHRFSRNDVYAVVSQFSNHATGWTTWYDFLSDNWNPISDRYKNDDLVWKEMIKLATQHFITQEGLDKVKALHLAHERDFGSAESEIQAAEIKGMQEVKWSNKNLAAMEAWLDRNLQQ
ncbi:aminopeptidase N-like isoform X2 [Periplaneta americana]|uniref:aminopeptidase N-like isoform X2 n=1 Tax=Periplaneta americana TaxID=6978 RepID=UPI0037E721F1